MRGFLCVQAALWAGCLATAIDHGSLDQAWLPAVLLLAMGAGWFVNPPRT